MYCITKVHINSSNQYNSNTSRGQISAQQRIHINAVANTLQDLDFVNVLHLEFKMCLNIKPHRYFSCIFLDMYLLGDYFVLIAVYLRNNTLELLLLLILLILLISRTCTPTADGPTPTRIVVERYS